MATSKHFPLQKFSTHKDNDDYNLNETPYNSVSSFKSYHSNQNRNSVSSAPPYIDVFEFSDDTPNTPYNEVKDASQETAPKEDTNSEEYYLDNTVVSAYKGTKPPIPAHKPQVLKNKSRQASASVIKQKAVTNEVPEPRKFGVENLQSFSQQLQDGNKELRKNRNSKDPSQACEGKLLNHVQGKSDGSVNDLTLPSREIPGVISPFSQGEHENGRHSSMSRRKLPKVPVPMAEPKIVPDMKTDIENDSKAVPSSRAVVPKPNHVVSDKEFCEKSMEMKKAVQSDNELSAQSAINVTNKFIGIDPNENSNIPKPRVIRRFKKGRVRDKSRSLSVGDQTKETAERARKMLEGKDEGLGRNNVTDLEKNDLKPSANEGLIKLVKPSQQEYTSNKLSSHINSDINNVDQREDANLLSMEYSAKCTGTSTEVCHEHFNDKCDMKEENETSLHAKSSSNSGLSGKHLDKTEDIDEIGSDHDDYSVIDTLNNIVDNASTELTGSLPENTFFSFDNEVIQQLTDSVMEKKAGRNSDVKDIPDYKNETDNDDVANIGHTRTTSNESKIDFEGMSVKDKVVDANELRRNLSVDKNVTETFDKSDDKNTSAFDNVNKENEVCNVKPQKKVERSPSYRKKVMARAKSRHKKSSMLKECSCTRNEKGEIVMCQFCENYENRKRRSRSRLGLESVGVHKDISEQSEGENSDISSYSEISGRRRAFSPGLPPLPSSKSPRPLRKLQVSSRVDVLMSSDLFKKHLQKHENLLHKHTVLRRAGMRKSFSNLDLSEGYIIDSDSQCDTESVTSETNFETDTSAKEDMVSQSSDLSTLNTKGSRRHSLTGDSDSPVETLHIGKKKHFRTLPTTVGRSRMPIPSFSQPNFSGSKSRPNIPSFKEFKFMKEISKSTEALNVSENESREKHVIRAKVMSDSSFDHVSCKNKVERVDKPSETVLEKRNEYVEIDQTEELIPTHLEVIKESHSKENLLNLIPTKGGEHNELSDSHINKTNDIGIPVDPNKQRQEIGNKADKEISEKDTDSTEHIVKSSIKENANKLDNHRILTKQQSTPDLNTPKHRIRPKLKSRTMSRLDIDSDGFSDTASGPDSVAFRERRKPGAKRPRSLISKKSSLTSLIQEAEKVQCSEDADSNSEKSIRARPKLKAGHVVNRSKSDSKYEIEKGRETDKELESRSDGSFLLEKGKNTVCFDLDDRSQCSPFDIGESETSTSMIESLSDSIRSEVRNVVVLIVL